MNKRDLKNALKDLHKKNIMVSSELEYFSKEVDNFFKSLHPTETTKVGTNKQPKEYYNGDWCSYTKGNCASPSMDACKTCHCYKL